MKMIDSQRGSILTYTVILLGVVAVVAFSATAIAGINTVTNAHSQTKSTEAEHILYGCLDEALFQLNQDIQYDPGTVTIGEESCTLVVTDTTFTTKDLDFSVVNGSVTRRLHVEISTEPLSVTSVLEE